MVIKMRDYSKVGLYDHNIKSYEKVNIVLDGLYSWDELLVLREKFKSKLKLICINCYK